MNAGPRAPTLVSQGLRRRRGFTLIEMMITVAIIGILTAIALPSYSRYVERTHRTNAKNTLQQVTQWMERAATASGRYPLSSPAPSQIPPGILLVDGGRYQVTVDSTDGQNFVVTATPVGAQIKDACGSFTLNQAGRRDVKDGTLPAQECWQR